MSRILISEELGACLGCCQWQTVGSHGTGQGRDAIQDMCLLADRSAEEGRNTGESKYSHRK